MPLNTNWRDNLASKPKHKPLVIDNDTWVVLWTVEDLEYKKIIEEILRSWKFTSK